MYSEWSELVVHVAQSNLHAVAPSRDLIRICFLVADELGADEG